MVLGSTEQAIEEAFGPYLIEAMEQLREADFLQFEFFLQSLNSIYIKIIASLDTLLQTEFSKASNYEELSFSIGQLKKINA